MKVQSSNPAGTMPAGTGPAPPPEAPSSKFSDVMAKRSSESPAEQQSMAAQSSTPESAESTQASESQPAEQPPFEPPANAEMRSYSNPASSEDVQWGDPHQPAGDVMPPEAQPQAFAGVPGEAQPVALAGDGSVMPQGSEFAVMQQPVPGETIAMQPAGPGEFVPDMARLERPVGESAEFAAAQRERFILGERGPMLRGPGDLVGPHVREGQAGEFPLAGGPVLPAGPEGVAGAEGLAGAEGVLGPDGTIIPAELDPALAAEGKGKAGKKDKSEKEERLEDLVLKNLEEQEKEEDLEADAADKAQFALAPPPNLQIQPQEVQATERPRPVYDAQAIRGIVQEVRMVANPGDRTQIEIQLTSKTLDGLNIKIDRNEEGRLAIQFNTTNNDVAQLLERNMANLQQSLASHGLRVANLQVVNPVVSPVPMFQQTFQTSMSSSHESYSGDRDGDSRGQGDQGGQGGGQEQGGGGGGGQGGRRGRR